MFPPEKISRRICPVQKVAVERQAAAPTQNGKRVAKEYASKFLAAHGVVGERS